MGSIERTDITRCGQRCPSLFDNHIPPLQIRPVLALPVAGATTTANILTLIYQHCGLVSLTGVVSHAIAEAYCC
jgi:hypothetical protein